MYTVYLKNTLITQNKKCTNKHDQKKIHKNKTLQNLDKPNQRQTVNKSKR